jgi:7,8-dihydropterin-6-yl-methyl-4-(beta-D-ribofuranosyl)aminobenzene 5'-phosphate synthase
MIDIEDITFTTLCDNTVGSLGCIGEWGFSVFVDIRGVIKILFDTGGRKAVVHNAEVMGIRLSEADKIILSHGHPDHSGGLLPVLECMKRKNSLKETDILCHPAALQPQYAKHGPEEDYIHQGIPYSLEELESLGATFTCSRGIVHLTDDITASGEIPMKNDFEVVAPIFFLKGGDGYVRSTVEDDQALFIKTSAGLVIILGCAHRGMINTIDYARKSTGMEEVYMVIGGTHLINTSKGQLSSTVAALKRIDVKRIGVSHCTGMYGACYLAEKLGKTRFFFNTAGTRMTFVQSRVKVQAFEKHEG